MGNSICTKRVKGSFLCNLIDKLTGLCVMVIVSSNLKDSTVVHSDKGKLCLPSNLLSADFFHNQLF